MADPSDGPSRLRGAASRAAATPSRVQWLYANQEAVNESLRALLGAVSEVAARLDRLEAIDLDRRLAQLDQDQRAGVTAVGEEIHRLRGTLDAQLAELDAAVSGQAEIQLRIAATAARDAEHDRLRAELGPSPEVRAGLSVFTICWNHGGLLVESARSGLAVLDRLPVQRAGELLILDDGSSDETAAVAADLAAADPRVRVITARTNLGLARARNTLLHAVATGHAFQLDADNTAAADGVQALYDVAERYRSAFTYGNVVRHDRDGRAVGVMSNEPLAEAWLRGNYIDTMAVIDVARVRALGGWPTDPVLEHIDDWALVHRLARAGELVGFVPVVAGRHRALASSSQRSVADRRIGPTRLARTFNPDGRLTADSIAAFAAHPAVGPLWSTPAALARCPDLSPAPPRPASPTDRRPRLLVVGPGGVANLGDDAIVAAALDQLRTLAPGHALDVLTDGPAPLALGRDATWLGTLSEAVWSLTPRDLPDDHDLAAVKARIPAAPWSLRTVDPAAYVGAVFAGGGNLTSLWADTLVAPRVVLGAALAHAGVPYVVSGQGLGPLDADDRPMMVRFLDGARAVALRDDGSLAVLSGRLRVPPTVTGDDALLLASASRAVVRAALDEAGVTGAYLAVTAREAPYVDPTADGLERWARAVDTEAHQRGLVVLGVAVNDQPERPEIATLARLAHGGAARSVPWRVLPCDDPALLAGVMAQASATMAQSYHAALLALRAGIPTVLAAASPYYRAKADGLSRLADIDVTVAVDGAEDLTTDVRTRLDQVAEGLARGGGLAVATEAVAAWWRGAVASLLSPERSTPDRDTPGPAEPQPTPAAAS